MCRHLLAALVTCSFSAALLADAVVLHDGRRLEGRIVGGTANQLHLRRLNEAGQGAIEIIDREQIARIERTPRGPQSRPADTTASAPEVATRPAVSSGASATAPVQLRPETQRGLIVVVAKMRAEDYTGAGTDISRLINSAGPGEWDAMSEMTQRLAGKPLDKLAAELHLRGAIASRRGPGLRLSYVTEYEKPALIPMLIRAYEATLKSSEDELRVVYAEAEPPAAPPPAQDPIRPAIGSAPARPWYEAYAHAQSRPAAAGEPEEADGASAIVDWIDRPDAFEGSAAEGKALMGRTYQALSLLNERIRLDPGLRRNADLKRRLLNERQRLTALAKSLEARLERPPRRSAPPDPKAVAAEKERREEYEKKWQAALEAEAKRLVEAREAARKWQEEQEKTSKEFSLFDWLKPSGQNQPAPAAPPSPAEPAETR